MFQSFEDKTDPQLGPPKLADLRRELKKQSLDGFIVPHSDRFQGEYLQPRDERLMWLTGFSGSAGFCIVLQEAAALFVDGRYTLQASRQTDGSAFTIETYDAKTVDLWIKANTDPGAHLGFDPWLHTRAATIILRRTTEAVSAKLVPVAVNPIDTVWPNQPVAHAGEVTSHKLEYAGQSAADKLANLRDTLSRSGEDAILMTLSDSISWLFNIRGADVTHTPVVHGFALVEKEKATLFAAPEKFGDAVRAALEPLTSIAPESDLAPALDALGKAGATVLLDTDTAADWLATRLKDAGAKINKGTDPTILPKARKNKTEAEGARKAHARDGVAMARFLAFIDVEAPTATLDEITAAKKLEQFRTETNQLLEISFDTISAAGPNAALPHYRVSTQSNRTIGPGSFYLVDSGGQYHDGTTDITRTVAIGGISDEMKCRYTLVLKGHIAIATARFPIGTSGAQLDTLARAHLWSTGEDFDHGTGHGVGSYLSVHEGPQRISKAGHVALEPGMIVSNEPGFYKEGDFGIRIENLVLVTEPAEIPGGSRPMLGFETLSFTPIDTRPIVTELLEDAEIDWLNAYHAQTRAKLESQLEGTNRDWLMAATEAIGRK